MKYIIEIEDVPFSKVRIDADNGAQNINLYRAKGFNSLVFDQFGLDKLTPLDTVLEEVLEGAYQKGYVVGQHEATTLEYQQGLDDAWKAIMKIAKMPDGERGRVFGDCWISNILNKFSATEIINILDGYEPEQDEIKVGNEVTYTFKDGTEIVPFVVFKINDDGGNRICEGLQVTDGRWVGGGLDYKKTGRHFPQVEELLKAMKGGAE